MSDEKPKYNQNRRLKQAQMQRQVRQSQRRLNRLRIYYKLFLIFGMLFLCYFIYNICKIKLYNITWEERYDRKIKTVQKEKNTAWLSY